MGGLLLLSKEGLVLVGEAEDTAGEEEMRSMNIRDKRKAEQRETGLLYTYIYIYTYPLGIYRVNRPWG